MIEPTGSQEHRFGKSPFWLSLTPEEHGMSTSLRCAVVHRPARAGKNNLPTTLLDITPRRPLFSLVIGDDTYPLLIDRGAIKRGGRITLSGQRKVGPARRQTVTWTTRLTPRVVEGMLVLDCQAQFRCSPPERRPAVLQVRIGCGLYCPLALTERTARARCRSAAGAWDGRNKLSLSAVLPDFRQPDLIEWNTSGFLASLTEIDLRGRVPVHYSLAFSLSKTQTDAQDALRRHFAETAGLELPLGLSDSDSLQDAARVSIAALTRPEAHRMVGTQRVYLRSPGADDPDAQRYAAGFPHFAVEAARALMTWHKFHPNEIASHLAEQIARGVASDFAVLAAEQGPANNRGAFWDIATAGPDGQAAFSDDKGEKTHNLLANTRVALALYDLFNAAGDPLFRQSALNTCHWLMLKQNDHGYYDGERVNGENGLVEGMPDHFAGVAAIRPMVASFRATGNEVFIKTAWKVAKHLLETVLPLREAPCLVDGLPERDCPLALAAAIESLADLYDEAANKDLRAALLLLGYWLTACDFTATDRSCLNYDGAWGGVIDCAFAALRLHGLERDPQWLRLGHELLRALPPRARQGWRGVEIYTYSLLSVAALLRDARVQFQKLTVQIGWQTYVPDASAGEYLSVVPLDTPGRVDLLPLVSRQNDQALVLILAEPSVERVEIVQSNRRGLGRLMMCDLLHDKIVTNPVSLTPLPYPGGGQAGIFRIDP